MVVVSRTTCFLVSTLDSEDLLSCGGAVFVTVVHVQSPMTVDCQTKHGGTW